MYLFLNSPFNEDDINYFLIQNIHRNKTISSYFSNQLKKNLDVSIYISEKLQLFIFDKIGLNLNNQLINLQKESNDNNEDEEIMKELNAFEEDLSTVISNIELDMFQNVRRKSEKQTNYYNAWKIHGLSFTNPNRKSLCLESTPGSDKTQATSLTAFLYEKKNQFLSNSKSTNNKYDIHNQNELQTKLVHPFSGDNFKSTFHVSFINKYNQSINCKLIIIHHTLYIEKEYQCKCENDKRSNLEEFNNNNLYTVNNSNSNNYNIEYINIKGNDLHCLSYKFFKLIPLRSVYAIDLGSIEIRNSILNGMKLVSHMHNISYDIILYSQDASHIQAAISLINKIVGIRDIKEDYDLQSDMQIGQGSYSKVYYAINKKTKEKVAIKEIENYNKKKDHLLFKRECEILQYVGKINNDNVVKLMDIYKSSSSLFMVFEYLQGMTLMKYLQENKGNISIHTKIIIVNQIANGINFLHTNNIIHRDIKADNIIVTFPSSSTSNTNEPLIKIIDFGFASVIGKDEYCNECYGTLLYIAPELLMRKKYYFPADIWSFSVVLYQILFYHLPFGETIDDLKEIQAQIIQSNYTIPTNFVFTNDYQKYVNVLKKCLVTSSDKRLTSNQIKNELDQ